MIGNKKCGRKHRFYKSRQTKTKCLYEAISKRQTLKWRYFWWLVGLMCIEVQKLISLRHISISRTRKVNERKDKLSKQGSSC